MEVPKLINADTDYLNSLKPIEIIAVPMDFTGTILIKQIGKTISYVFESDKLKSVTLE